MSKALRFACLWAQERAAETVEYVGAATAVMALLLAAVSFFGSSGGEQIGVAIVRTLQCFIFFETDCLAFQPAPEIAAVPERGVIIDETIYDPALSVPELFSLWTGGKSLSGEDVLGPPQQLRRFPIERNWDGTLTINGTYQGECLLK